MNRRNFLALSFLGPLLVLPRPKPRLIWAPPGYEDKARELIDSSFPKMDRFVNDDTRILYPQGTTRMVDRLFWMHPCSKPECTSPRDYWLHNG